jgi:hypothetical protein
VLATLTVAVWPPAFVDAGGADVLGLVLVAELVVLPPPHAATPSEATTARPARGMKYRPRLMGTPWVVVRAPLDDGRIGAAGNPVFACLDAWIYAFSWCQKAADALTLRP